MSEVQPAYGTFHLTNGESVMLDFIRGTAAQAVLFGHAISFFGVLPFLKPPYVPWMQSAAVVVFFLLSGFIITWSVMRKRAKDPTYNFGRYSVERFTRIFAAFVPALFFVLLLDGLSININGEAYSYRERFSVGSFFANFFMLQNNPIAMVTSSDTFAPFGSASPFWTLAIEWWIYLLFGFMVLRFFPRSRRRGSDWLLLPLVLFIPFFNAVNGTGNGLSVSWVFGAVACLFYPAVRRAELGLLERLAALGIALVGATVRAYYLELKVYDPIVAFFLTIAMVICLDWASKASVPGLLERIIRWNAGVSYTLYLIHYSILDFLVITFPQTNRWLLFIAGLVISNLAALLLGYYAEMRATPVLRKKIFAHLERRQAAKAS